MAQTYSVLRNMGLRLRKLRQEKSLTQEALATKMQMTGGNISAKELGKSQLSVYDLIHFCKAFHVTPNYILGFSSDRDELRNMSYDEKMLVKAHRKLKSQGLKREALELVLSKSKSAKKDLESNKILSLVESNARN